MSRKKQKADCRADTRGGPWAGIPVCVINSPSYRDLGLWARAILVEITARMNGYNNGKIAMSQREISDALGNSNMRKIGRAVAELIEHGFLDVSAEGIWKQRQAREYRLTFINTMQGHFTKPATNDYLKWQPKKKSSHDDASAGKGKSADGVSASANLAADDASARKPQKPQSFVKLPKNSADDASSLICKPYPTPKCKGDQTNIPDPEIAGGTFVDAATGERLTA